MRKNVIFERAKFNQRLQKDGESIKSFINDLHDLVEYCNYGNLRGIFIRDRIVVGIRDSRLSEKLQLDENLTLEKAAKSAAVKEQAVIRNEGASRLGKVIVLTPVGTPGV